MYKLTENKIILGLSGGVDSTTAALLLKEKGMKVTGLFIDVTGNNYEGREGAERVANELGIEFDYKDASKDFKELVLQYFEEEYLKGRTPNPCVVCNPNIKFDILARTADERGAAYIATGHYARTYFDNDLKRWFIRKGLNEKKDQSYMLYRLPQEIISRLILPLGDMDDKEKVRQIAASYNLSSAAKTDSQEICFIKEGQNYADYLEERGVVSPQGPFLDSAGNVIGQHKGILNYTIGQRKGLGNTFGKPMFVKEIRRDENAIVLCEQEQDLFSSHVISGDNIMALPFEGLKLNAKIRYAAKASPCFIRLIENNKIETIFDEPQRAPTPGQSIVFYLDDFVIGGGFIEY